MNRRIFVFVMMGFLPGSIFAASAEKQPLPPFKAVSLGAATLTQVYPRVFTPNGDGRNDRVIFQFDNPAVLPIKGEVFDATGGRVGTLSPLATSPDTTLVWDGKRNGRSLPGGVYLYKVQVGDESASGTVVLAR